MWLGFFLCYWEPISLGLLHTDLNTLFFLTVTLFPIIFKFGIPRFAIIFFFPVLASLNIDTVLKVSLVILSLSFIYNSSLGFNEKTSQFISSLTILLVLMAAVEQFVPSVFQYIHKSRGSSNRGLSSLFSEPSSFGLSMLLIADIGTELNGSKRWKIVKILAIILSQSAIVALVWFFQKISYKRFVLLITLFLIVESSGLRIVSITNKLIMDPLLLLEDSSINRRLAHLVLPIEALLKGQYLWPLGIDHLSSKFALSSFSKFETQVGGNLMTLFGQLIMYFGLFIFPLLFIILNFLFRFKKLSYLPYFISSISLTNPFLLLLLMIFYEKYLHRRNRS